MKKVSACTTAFQQTRPRFTLPAWIIGGVTMLGLAAGLGLLASRPAHTAGGPIAVNVTNAPLSTTPTDNSAKQGVQFNLNLDFASGNTDVNDYVYTVPTGKRLVVESVTSATNVFGDSSHYSLYYFADGGLGNRGAYDYFSMLPDGSPYSTGVSHTPLYVEAGQQIYLQADRTETSGGSSINVSFSGYLVDIATPGGSS